MNKDLRIKIVEMIKRSGEGHIPSSFSIVDIIEHLYGKVLKYNKDDANYELYGICNHSGGCSGGHYTAHIKCANNKWYLFNDTVVSEDKKFSGRDNVLGYCLFYKKV